jgi:hypothetical protein
MKPVISEVSTEKRGLWRIAVVCSNKMRDEIHLSSLTRLAFGRLIDKTSGGIVFINV